MGVEAYMEEKALADLGKGLFIKYSHIALNFDYLLNFEDVLKRFKYRANLFGIWLV
jgi:hypothetical protein